MTNDELERLAKLADAATAGPWVTHIDGHLRLMDETAAFIAAARTAVPELLAEVRRLRAALDQCDMVMDTAAIHGLPQELPDVYRNSWAAAHIAARKALGGCAYRSRETAL